MNDTLRLKRDLGIARIYADWLIAHGDTADEANGQIILRVLADHERLERRLFPGQGESYANEVERQRVVIDGLQQAVERCKADRDELAAAVERVRAQHQRTAWNLTAPRADDEIRADVATERTSTVVADVAAAMQALVRDVPHLLARAERAEAELWRFKPEPMSQHCRDGKHGMRGAERCQGCYCLCHTADSLPPDRSRVT